MDLGYRFCRGEITEGCDQLQKSKGSRMELRLEKEQDRVTRTKPGQSVDGLHAGERRAVSYDDRLLSIVRR